MKARHFFTLCVCAALFCVIFQIGVSAEPEIDRTNRRDPFASLLTVPPSPPPPLPSENRTTVLQQFDLKQFRVIGIVLGELGHHAIVLAPDGKRYMISKGTPIGQFDGTVTDIAPNSIQVTEIYRFEEGNEITTKDVEHTLSLDPLKTSKTPESRFVIVDK